jgi:feruloyl esterase
MGDAMVGKILAGMAVALMLACGAAKASPCTDLNGRVLENGLVRAAIDVRAGDTLRLAGVNVSDLPAFCRLVASAGVDRHSNILVELWLPEAAAWNRKLLGTGNGGMAGSISFSALRGGLKRGYAVMNTDMGTFPASSADWAAGTGQPEMLKDWGYRSTHEMTMLGAALTRLYYGEAPQRRYFVGCSTGGHQALMEAQLYPDDYDGIIAGAPANNRTHLHLSFLQVGLDVHATAESWLDGSHVALVHAAVLKTCAGRDGGAPGDAFLTDPTACAFRPRQLLCKAGQDSQTCLNAAQVTALERIYGGAANARTGQLFYPGWPLGGEVQLAGLFGDRDRVVKGFVGSLVPWAMGPRFDVTKFDFDKDLDKTDAELAPVMNQVSPDLSAFARHGGKLIVFHGLTDGIVGPLDTVNYFERVGAAMPDRDAFARLYLAPGMDHCTGGAGPDLFGQNPFMPEGDAGHDLLVALDAWSREGRAPDAVIATRQDTAGAVTMARPLCPYPAKAVWQGGDAKAAASFRCVTGKGMTFVRPAAAYLK